MSQISSQPLLSLVASERAFAKATSELGVRNGFLTFFAADAITFEPNIGLYRESLQQRPASSFPLGFILRWAPEEGDVSRSEDIGYLTGPYTVEAAVPASAPSSGGWFFSVWKKQNDGTWKVFIDVGIETPLHGLQIDSVPFVPAELHTSSWTGGTAAGLRTADSLLNQDLATGENKLRSLMSEGVRFHRNGWFPIKGLTEVRSYLSSAPYGTASAIFSEVSAAGDLGYTYGSYTNPSSRGFYVRIWKRTAGETWNVVLDVTTEQK